MELRNPRFTADGRIDCEIEHPQFGWIPFTASQNDVEARGRSIYAAALAAGPAPARQPETPVIAPEDIKAEAYRRIVALCPEWKQRNLTAQAVLLAEKGRANWTAEETAAWEAGKAIWDRIAAIRSASDDLEAMDPTPVNYDAAKWWP